MFSFLVRFSIILSAFYAPALFSIQPLHTERLFVLFDAGETTSMIPVMEKLNEQKKDFHIFAMATAESLLKDKFPGKTSTLKDLGAKEIFDKMTPRTTALSPETLVRLANYFRPITVTAGCASLAQEQILAQFNTSQTFVFVDNFNYDPNHESFKTVRGIIQTAKNILCPSQDVASFFKTRVTNEAAYHVVGKPLLDKWEQDIALVDKAKVLEKTGLSSDQPIITLIGGYGGEYEVINPLFESLMNSEDFKKAGYQVYLQPHPRMAAQKVNTVDLLAISDYIVGYNTSVILDAALIGKNALYLIPKEIPFSHFAIERGLIRQVSTAKELLQYIQSGEKPANVRIALEIPLESADTIIELIDEHATPICDKH